VSEDTLVVAEHVSKKFCRSLRRSLWYGVRDVAGALVPWSRTDGHASHSQAALVNAPHRPLRRDEFWAVEDVSFELKRGECLGLIGHNGAGKSTLLKVLNGLIPPDGGRITTHGRVAALIELNAGFNPILSGRENIYNQAALVGFNTAETESKFDKIVDFAEIGDFLDMPVQNYSSGMRVRLGFAVAAQMEPDVLIIDEVLAVGDVAFRFKCLNAIGELMRSAAVIFVSHTMPQVFRLCNEVIVMDHGSVTYQGRNVAEGVAVYLSLFKESPKTITGSGQVRVTDVRIQSGNHRAYLEETLRIPFGAGMALSARLQASPEVRFARLQFLLWNAEMLPIMDVMADGLAGYSFEFPSSGIIDISAVIPRTELNAGKYTLSVIAASPDYAVTYCRHDNAAYVQIDAGSTSGAQILSVAEWTSKEASMENIRA
jgi:lipopolysaccharide transport system ATP-binding protein